MLLDMSFFSRWGNSREQSISTDSQLTAVQEKPVRQKKNKEEPSKASSSPSVQRRMEKKEEEKNSFDGANSTVEQETLEETPIMSVNLRESSRNAKEFKRTKRMSSRLGEGTKEKNLEELLSDCASPVPNSSPRPIRAKEDSDFPPELRLEKDDEALKTDYKQTSSWFMGSAEFEDLRDGQEVQVFLSKSDLFDPQNVTEKKLKQLMEFHHPSLFEVQKTFRLYIRLKRSY